MPLALTVKKKRTVRFEGLAEFKWSDLGEQDVVGQGSFGAVFMDFESSGYCSCCCCYWRSPEAYLTVRHYYIVIFFYVIDNI